jgi:hypothetical protein
MGGKQFKKPIPTIEKMFPISRRQKLIYAIKIDFRIFRKIAVQNMSPKRLPWIALEDFY